ncbi:cell division protein FtsA [Cohaesibacter haloalkalitolerans]|uniref:cell division protein FtsA n=1 Tax=Cohaesibacter haloalkalitolerans TaxID=1162980 RepID=UPI000E65539C|nr:cell division protein FtsA [Cohaesibacter haloalkalitolerans]
MIGSPWGKRDSRGRGLIHKRSQIITILDVGSTKICCMIARLVPRPQSEALPHRTHTVQVLGFGLHQARGIKSGVVVDLDQAENSIRLAVGAAETQADMTVQSLIVNVSCGRIHSDTLSASVSLSGHEVDEVDIRRVLQAGASHLLTMDRTVVHSMPIGYSLDGGKGIRDPRGMIGDDLAVDMHVVTAQTAPLKNLELCINRCHLDVAAMVATPYASGLSCLVDDESELGVACVDLGGGTTSISIFVNGQFVHSDAIAMGGHHVTMDLARGLSTRLADAERIKTLYGSALLSLSDDQELVAVPPVGDDDRDLLNQVPKASLTRIIKPRVEEILEVVRDRIEASGFSGHVGRRVVLTGGGSQLTGMAETARRIMGRNVRLGRPLGVAGLPDIGKGPAFATAVGLMIYPQVAQIEQFEKVPIKQALNGSSGRGGIFRRWFTESF